METVETAAMVSLTNTRRRGQQVNLSSMSMIYRRLEEEGANCKAVGSLKHTQVILSVFSVTVSTYVGR